jgi:hypothetical protein
VFSCRQEVNFQGVCLNGTHPYLLAGFRPFLTFLVKVDVRSDYGQWAESTKPRELSRGGQPAKNQLKMHTDALPKDRSRAYARRAKTLSAVGRLC